MFFAGWSLSVLALEVWRQENPPCAYSSHNLFCFVYSQENLIETDHVPHDTGRND